ncbi:unnamed protein product [Heterobilharzia americana]|nr:unnamed protein product [Heterobilharzia americana]
MSSSSNESDDNDTVTQGKQNFDLRRFLSTEREQLIWYSQGLPSDQLSGENAVTVVHTERCPFIVDPSSRALNWLKTHLKDQRLEVITPQSPNFVTTLELAVRFGKCLIIQEVDEIEPILMPLLSKDLILQGSRNSVMLGEKTPGTVQPINATSLVTIVNFITTRAGLIDQLLEITLQNERPELENRRQQLVRDEENMKIELAQLENDLLEELANAHGNILENKELLTSLNKTKQSSLIVTNSLKESLRLQSELDKERNIFHPLAETGSRLYFALKDLVKINHMYQFSLNSFLYLFKRALSMPYDTGLQAVERIKSLQKLVEILVYENVSRALFKSDRLIFALHLVHIIRPQSLTDEEWLFFIGLSVTESHPAVENAPSWLDRERARNVLNLKAALPSVYENLCFGDAKFWTNWLHENDVETKSIPSALNSKSISPFHYMVLAIQALRPDRLHTALSQFTIRTLDLPQLSPSTLNLHRLFESETRPTEPVLILITPGADPSQELEEAAKIYFARKEYTKTTEKISTSLAVNYRQIAMGQGQTDLAISELRDAAKSVLEKEINKLLFNVYKKGENTTSNYNNGDIVKNAVENNYSVHEDFRLWLTAEPRTTFPCTLLQGCLKIAYEAPPGLKRNLRRTYETWPRNYISQGNSKTRASLLACLAWFHAVVQERRTYIPQGWTKFYEFTFADLRTGAEIIDRLLLTDHGKCLEQLKIDETVRNLQLGPFKLPGTTELKDYIVQIDALPDHDLPTHFNLSPNIESSLQRSEANRVIAQLRLLNRPLMDSQHKFDKSVWSKELGPVLILWKKLNQGLNLIQSRASNQSKRFPVSKTDCHSQHEDRSTNERPVREFLQLELHNALQLVQSVHSSLASLSRACRGTQLVRGNLYQLANSLLKGETPDSWLSQWPEGPDEVVPFLKDLVAKRMLYRHGLSKPKMINLANLFRPTTFLNALRQQTARQLDVSIDTLKLSCQWLQLNQSSSMLSTDNNKSIAVRITNLKLEGANFRNGQLSQSYSDDPSLIQLPDIILKWIPKHELDPLCENDSISLPIYLNNTRSNLMTHIRVPCPPGSQNQWIQAGTALLLSCA